MKNLFKLLCFTLITGAVMAEDQNNNPEETQPPHKYENIKELFNNLASPEDEVNYQTLIELSEILYHNTEYIGFEIAVKKGDKQAIEMLNDLSKNQAWKARNSSLELQKLQHAHLQYDATKRLPWLFRSSAPEPPSIDLHFINYHKNSIIYGFLVKLETIIVEQKAQRALESAGKGK